MAREKGSKRLRVRWIAASLVLHTALVTLATGPRPEHLSHRKPPENPPELDVTVEYPLEPELERQPEPEPDSALSTRSPASSHPASPQLAKSNGLAADDAVESAEGTATIPDSAAPEGDVTSTENAGPRLSLTDLGVGSTNPFVRNSTEQQKKADKARTVQRRLDRALAQGLLDHDSKRGHGAGSPVMRILESATYASATPANGTASFTFVIDSDGKLVSGALGAVSSDREAWERVARQALRDLANHKLRVPKGKGVRLTVQVTSHLELPSGADPGVEVRAFGLPVKRGDGPRSTRVDILNPLNPGAPLTLMGDPADIGATARRMVRAHVTSEELM